MSDHGHHDPGGHELEAVNSKALFRLLISLSLITLLASIAVIQWFYSQRRALDAEHNAEGSFRLHAYQADMDEALTGIDGVAKDIAANPKLLAGLPAPDGWIHPDDLAGAAAAPAEGEHAEDKPAEDKPAEPAAPAEGEGEAAEGDAADAADAGEEPAAEGEGDKPASNEGNDAEGQDKPAANNDDEGADKPADKPDNG